MYTGKEEKRKKRIGRGDVRRKRKKGYGRKECLVYVHMHLKVAERHEEMTNGDGKREMKKGRRDVERKGTGSLTSGE